MKLWLFACLLSLCSASGTETVTMSRGAGSFSFTRADKSINVWYFVPEHTTPDMPVQIVMHGVKRDAERYRNDWQRHAAKHGFILVAPEFSETLFPGSDNYNLGGIMDGRGRRLKAEEGAFSFIVPVFEAVKQATGNQTQKFNLFGHSAGAQFVHRYLLFMPDAPVKTAVAANAGWWTMPDLSVRFPYGLQGSVLDEAGLKAALQRPLTVLLGTLDTDPNHPELRRTPEAMAQGPHRWARGHKFFEQAQASAKASGVPLAWKLETAPGVAHEDKGMAEVAVRLLYGR